MISRLKIVMFVALVVSLTGCATWTGDMLPKDRVKDVARRDTMIDYTCRLKGSLDEKTFYQNQYQERVEDILKTTGAVAGYTLGSGVAPIHIDFRFSEQKDSGAIILTSFLSAATGTLIPACGTTKMELVVDVIKERKLLKTYRYPNEIKRCIQLFLMFYPSEYGMDAGRYVIDDMITRFLLDAQKDGVL